jgi:hypothetical protein
VVLGCAVVPLLFGGGLARAQAACSLGSGGVSVTCSYGYTGAAQTFTVPAGVGQAGFVLDGAPGGFNGGGNGGTTMCAAVPLTVGQAACVVGTRPTGSDQVTATYSGDLRNGGGHGSVTLTVKQSSTRLAAAAAAATLSNLGSTVTVTGLAATLTDKITGAPVGGALVTFTDHSGRTVLCSATTNAAGTAACTATVAGTPLGNSLLVTEMALSGYTAATAGTADDAGAAATGKVTPAVKLEL